MGFVINDVTFYESGRDPKSPMGAHSIPRGQQTRCLYTRLGREEDIYVARRALLGFSKLETDVILGQGRRWIRRQIPHIYPSNPDGELAERPYLIASDVDRIEPVGKSSGLSGDDLSNYPMWKFYVEYNTRPYLVLPDISVRATDGPLQAIEAAAAPARPDEGLALESGFLNTRYIVKEPRGKTVQITLPGGFARIGVQNGFFRDRPIPAGWPYVQYEGTVRYTWMQVPAAAIPEIAIQVCAGHVNDGTFDGYPTGTLLFNDEARHYYLNCFGQYLADVTYTFLFKPNLDPVLQLFRGWNSYPAVDDAGRFRFAIATTDGSNTVTSLNAMYQFADFAQLFRPDQPT